MRAGLTGSLLKYCCSDADVSKKAFKLKLRNVFLAVKSTFFFKFENNVTLQAVHLQKMQADDRFQTRNRSAPTE